MANNVNDQSPTAAQQSEFWRQVDKGLITKKDFQEFLEKKKSNVNLFPQETSHLRLIGETTISVTKAGKGMDQNNKHPFDWVDNDFDDWDAQTVSVPTTITKALVYEQMKNGNYADIFGSLNTDLDLLEFKTHEQIKDFVEKIQTCYIQKDTVHTSFLEIKKENGLLRSCTVILMVT